MNCSSVKSFKILRSTLRNHTPTLFSYNLNSDSTTVITMIRFGKKSFKRKCWGCQGEWLSYLLMQNVVPKTVKNLFIVNRWY